MLPSIFDTEVEKYLGFGSQNDIRRHEISAMPGRFRELRLIKDGFDGFRKIRRQRILVRK